MAASLGCCSASRRANSRGPYLLKRECRAWGGTAPLNPEVGVKLVARCLIRADFPGSRRQLVKCPNRSLRLSDRSHPEMLLPYFHFLAVSPVVFDGRLLPGCTAGGPGA